MYDSTQLSAGLASGSQHLLTSFIEKNYAIQNIKWAGKEGWTVKFKETGYRGIPLWTVSKITVKLDGQEINSDDIVFFLDERNFKIADLKNQFGAQWWVFDYATLFIPKPGGLEVGSTHDVDIRMTYAALYNTSGTYREGTVGSTEKLSVITV